jgi:protein TonB
MTMQLKPDAFDLVGAHPVKRLQRAPVPARNRIGAAVITIIAHVIAITGIVTGLKAVQAFHPPPSVTVQIEPERKKPEETPPPAAPVFSRPMAFTAPIPEISIATQPPSPLTASPPSSLPRARPSLPNAPPSDSHAVPTWQGLLLARLSAVKRYPAAARFHHQQGVVLLRFSIDREGRVLSARIEKSSGVDSLDQETLALIQRAQPLPKPPAEMPGNPIVLVVPIEFSLTPHR